VLLLQHQAGQSANHASRLLSGILLAVGDFPDGRILIIDSVREDTQLSPLHPVYLRVFWGRPHGVTAEGGLTFSFCRGWSGCRFATTVLSFSGDRQLRPVSCPAGIASDRSRCSCTAYVSKPHAEQQSTCQDEHGCARILLFELTRTCARTNHPLLCVLSER